MSKNTDVAPVKMGRVFRVRFPFASTNCVQYDVHWFEQWLCNAISIVEDCVIKQEWTFYAIPPGRFSIIFKTYFSAEDYDQMIELKDQESYLRVLSFKKLLTSNLKQQTLYFASEETVYDDQEYKRKSLPLWQRSCMPERRCRLSGAYLTFSQFCYVNFIL